MAYDKFNILTSSAVPLPIENVDTDGRDKPLDDVIIESITIEKV